MYWYLLKVYDMKIMKVVSVLTECIISQDVVF